MTTELAAVSAAIADVDCLDELSETLRPDHFADPSLRAVYEAALQLRSSGRPVDHVTLGAALPGKTLPSPVQVSIERARAYGELVHASWVSRRLTTVATAAIDRVNPANATEVVNQLAADVTDLAVSRAGTEPQTLREPLKAVVAKMARAARGGGIVGLATGLAELDRVTGGLHDGELTIVAGRPGMAKSAFAFDRSAVLAESGEPTINFSLEMPSEQVAMRTACKRANVAVEAIRQGRVTQEEFDRLSKSAPDIATMPFFIDDSAALTPVQARAKMRKVQRQLAAKGKRLRLAVFDYLGLMHADRDLQSREQEVNENAMALKSIAKEFSLPVICIAQLNRNCETRPDKRPMLSDLRDSGGVEQAADAVVFLYREDYYAAKCDKPGLTELIVAKQRNGPTGTVFAYFDKRTTSFRDLTSEERYRFKVNE